MGEREDGPVPERPVPPYRREKERVEDEHLLGDDDRDVVVVPVPTPPAPTAGRALAGQVASPSAAASPWSPFPNDVSVPSAAPGLPTYRRPLAGAIAQVLKDLPDAPLPAPGLDAFEVPGLTTSASAPDESVRFMFDLNGPGVAGSAVLAGTAACLTFKVYVTHLQQIAVFENDALQQAGREGAAITLHATARGDLTLVGHRTGVATFNGGSMAPVSFFLSAAARPGGGPSSVHIDFTVKGVSVHEMDLPIAVVADESALAAWDEGAMATWDSRRQRLLDHSTGSQALLDAARTAGPPPDRRVRLSLSFADDQLCIELTDIIQGQDESEPQRYVAHDLGRVQLHALLRQVQADLQPVYADEMWRWFDGEMPLETGARRRIDTALARAMETVAVAGATLNRGLRQDRDLAQAIDYIEQQVALGATVTVATDTVFIPWEIVYPGERSAHMSEKQKQAHPLRPDRFWGARFAFETVQRGHAPLGQLRRTQLGAPSRVSLNMNPAISPQEVPPDRLPATLIQAWARQLDSNGQLDGGEVQSDCQAIRRVLQDGSHDASLIYVYCHGSSPDPFGGANEQLLLDDHAACRLSPADLVAGDVYPNAPIVFLNSCMSVALSPLTFSSFLAEFKRRGALGMIGTSFSVPMVYAAQFGRTVVDAYLQRRGSLAVALWRLRRDRLLNQGNPVPLFYSLQCQLDFGPGGKPAL